MTTDPMAQDIIRCDLCPDEDCKSPVEMVCQTCNINLCSECVGRHISAELSLKLNVVGVKFIKSEMPSFSCKFHPKSNCELHCQECSVPVCVKCLATGNHKAHDVVEISSIYNKQIEFIKQDTQELKSVLAPTYEKMAQDLEKRKTNLPVSYGDFKSSILKRGKEWHDTVDVIIQKLLTQAEQMEKDDLKLLSDLHSDIRDILSSIQETIQENLDSLKLQTGTEIINYRSRNEQLRKVPKTFDIAGPVFLPMVIKEEQLRQLFGEIKSSMKIEVQGYNITCPTAKQVIYQPKVDKTISCPTNALKISCVPNTEEFFIKYNNSIQHLDNNGKMLNELRIKSGRKANINLTVTRNKKLIYSDYHDKSVSIVNCDNIDTIIRFESWRPLAVCSTSSDELLVSMKSNDESQSKVARYNQSTATQEIQFDTTGEPLYIHITLLKTKTFKSAYPIARKKP